MATYTQIVRNNILPLSIANTLPAAFAEWRFTGETEDYGSPSEVCRLCEKDGLRYHFEIQNDLTQRTLLVGSHCILKFEVAVYDDGRRLTEREAQSYLQKLTQKMRLESCIKSLEELSKSEKNGILSNALEYYRIHKCLTPKQAFVVFWRMSKNNIDHDPGFFSISLKKNKYVQDLKNMPTSRVHYFWKAMTSSQRHKAIELGHTSPSTE